MSTYAMASILPMVCPMALEVTRPTCLSPGMNSSSCSPASAPVSTNFPEGGDIGDAVDPGARGSGDLALQGQADPAPLEATFLDPQQGLAADEVALVEPDPATETHVEGGILLAYVGAVERKTLLDAQGLHGLQAVGLQVEPSAVCRICSHNAAA